MSESASVPAGNHATDAPTRLLFRPPMLGPAGVAMGIASIILGLLIWLLPGATLLLIAVLFGIQLVVQGGIRIVLGITAPNNVGWVKAMMIILGVLTVIAGVICFLRPGTSLVLLAIFLAAGWIVEGVASLAQMAGPGRRTPVKLLFGVSGLVSIIAGVVIMIVPGTSLILLTQLAGVALVVIGVFQIVAAVSARRQSRTAG